jgi:hypothetical protein
LTADAKDIEGEEALFTLYERWCKASGDERDQDEMRRRFNMLKDNNPVLFKYRLNKEEPVNIRINRLADREYRGEKCGKFSFPSYCYRMPPDTQIDVKVGKDMEADLINPLS